MLVAFASASVGEALRGWELAWGGSPCGAVRSLRTSGVQKGPPEASLPLAKPFLALARHSWGVVRRAWAMSPAGIAPSASGGLAAKGGASSKQQDGQSAPGFADEGGDEQPLALPQLTATPISCAGIVFADKLGGATRVTNILTCEGKTVPGAWSLILDDDGDAGILVNDDDPNRLMDLEDVLTRIVVMRDDTAELLTLDPKSPATTSVPLDSARTSQRLAVVSVQVGASAADYKFNLSVMKLARPCNQRVFWPLGELYAFFRLSSFSGIPSKWVHHSVVRWEKLFLGVFGHALVIHSTNMRGSEHKNFSRPWHERCMPATSAPTAGLVALLFRWSRCNAAAGGLSGDHARLAASELLRTLLHCVCSGPGSDDFSVSVAVVATWECRWPRPEEEGCNIVHIRCSKGKCDLRGLLDIGLRLDRAGVGGLSLCTLYVLGQGLFQGAECMIKVSFPRGPAELSCVLLPCKAELLFDRSLVVPGLVAARWLEQHRDIVGNVAGRRDLEAGLEVPLWPVGGAGLVGHRQALGPGVDSEGPQLVHPLALQLARLGGARLAWRRPRPLVEDPCCSWPPLVGSGIGGGLRDRQGERQDIEFAGDGDLHPAVVRCRGMSAGCVRVGRPSQDPRLEPVARHSSQVNRSVSQQRNSSVNSRNWPSGGQIGAPL